MIRVFLMENVAGLGKVGEIRTVKDAYAQNYLLGKGLAVLPNDPRALTWLKTKQSKNSADKADLVVKEKLVQSLNGKKFVILAKADEKGHLYGSIGPKEIAQAVGVNPNMIETHFKQIGIFPLEIKIGKFQAKMQIEIKNN